MSWELKSNLASAKLVLFKARLKKESQTIYSISFLFSAQVGCGFLLGSLLVLLVIGDVVLVVILLKELDELYS